METIVIKIESPNGNSFFVVNNLTSLNIESLDRGSLSDTTDWGIYSNSGEISFIDYNSNFKSIVESTSNLEEIQVAFSIRLDDQEQLLATRIVDNYYYNEESKEVSLTLIDGLLSWQDINVPRIFLYQETSIYDIMYNYLLPYMKRGIYIDSITKNRLSNTKIYCPDIVGGSLWEIMTKICEATHCRIFVKETGIPTISVLAMLSGDRPILISPYNLLDIKDYLPKRKTQIPAASLVMKDRMKTEDGIIGNTLEFNLYDVSTGEKYDDASPLSNRLNITWRGDTNGSVAALRLLISETNDYTGVYVGGSIDLPDTVYRYEEKPDITVRVCNPFVMDAMYFLNWQTQSTNSHNFPLYEPNKSSVEKSDNKLFMKFEDYNANDADRILSGGTIAVRGDFYVEGNDEVLSYGTLSSNVVSLPSNELMQQANTISSASYGQLMIAEVEGLYSDGIDCYELESTTGQYLYDDGEIAVGNKKLLFEKYDTVIPYVFRNGISQPLATYDDDNTIPKQFMIIGIKFHWQGVLKQSVMLHELPYSTAYNLVEI